MKMRLKELRRLYPYDEACKTFTLDVALEDYRDAYSDWDFSPFYNRDLDDDLHEYLLECSYEIPLKYDVQMKFHILNQEKNEVREERSKLGMINFFKYQLRRLNNRRFRTLGDIVSFLVIGTILLFGGTYIATMGGSSIVIELLSEGLYIGGWVMIWEMFSAWFFDMKKLNQQAKHYQRLTASQIIYKYE